MGDLKDKFVAWGKQHAAPLNAAAEMNDFSDLEPFKKLIGDAHVVTLGESHHYTREFNRFRSRLFRYLVTELGFKVFVLEVGIVEAKAASDYVALKHDDAQSAYAGVNQTFGFWAQQQEMLDWMRDYNVGRPEEERLRFYGMDGSQIWKHSATAVEAVCRYLDEVDPDYARNVRDTLLPLAQAITIEAVEETSEEDFAKLNYGMTKLVGRLATEQFEYVEKSSLDDFQWNLEFAESAQRIAASLTQVKDVPEDQGETAEYNIRDYYMGRQLKWVMDREGPDRRILCGADNCHLQPCGMQQDDDLMATMGQAFQHMVPKGAWVNIGGAANYSVKPNDPARPDSNQGALAEIGLESFLLDLRPAAESPDVDKWLSEPRPSRSTVNYLPLALGKGFDAIYYIERIQIDELRLPDALKVDRISLSENDLDAVTGKYVFGSGVLTEDLYVSREGTQLFSDVGENCDELFPMYKSELFAASKTEFRWQEWPMELTFDLGDDGVAKGLTVRIGGMDEYYYGHKA